jgi:metal-dependent amidase/aminoacylase/carboxypeptidase family protein
VAAAQGCQLKLEWIQGYPPTVNDPTLADYVAKTAQAMLGPDRFITAARPSMGGEDFAYYLEKIPGCFALLGVCPPGQDAYHSLHSNRYDFPDAALSVGMRMFLSLVLGFTPDSGAEPPGKVSASQTK